MDLYFFKDLQRKLSPKKKKKWPSTRLDSLAPGDAEASLGTPCQGPFYTVLAAQGKHRADRGACRLAAGILQFRHFSKVSETAFSPPRLSEQFDLSLT